MQSSDDSKPTFQLLTDLNWYRAVVINVKEKMEKTGIAEFDDLPADRFSYDVFFFDYGNNQLDLPSSLLHSFKSVKMLNKNLKFMSNDDLNYLLKLPFQALCFQLAHKKDNTRNNEIFKSVIGNYFHFDIKMVDVTKAKVIDGIEINKYHVKMSGDGTFFLR